MEAKKYAQALIEFELKGKKFDRFLEVLETHGHKKLLPKIEIEYVRLKAKKEERSHATVVLARKDDEKKFKKDIEVALKNFEVEKHDVDIDETIVGGYAIKSAGKRIDHSYRKALLSLYRTIIAN